MYLTSWEERALDGEFGEALATAMRVIVEVGEALDAEKLIPISHAHISGVSVHNIGIEGVEFIEEMALKGARVSVYTTANPCSIAYLKKYRDVYGEKLYELQRRVVRALSMIGVDNRSYTCIPYVLRRPVLGEHLAWAESSAVIYANSVLGARTNREGGPVALMAAIAGRTYYAGLHIDENRVPKVLVRVELDVNSIAMASAVGLYIGETTSEIPLIQVRLVADSVMKEVLIKSMLASIATTSSLAMVFLDGITPELQRIRTEISNLEKLNVDLKDIKHYFEASCSNVLLLGCPHMTMTEIRAIVGEIIKVEQLKKLGIEKLMVAVPRLVELIGGDTYNEITRHFAKHGIELEFLPGVCPVVSDLRSVGLESVSTVHGKARHYIPRLAGVKACLVNAL